MVVMLRSIGVECVLPDDGLKNALRDLGCDNVTDISGLVSNWGYDPVFPEAPLPHVGVADMARSDVIYVDVKAHRAMPRVLSRWPNLAGRILWYRINGAKPEHVVNTRGDMGDEVNPGCPVLTPNLWYRDKYIDDPDPTHGHYDCGGKYQMGLLPAPWESYACWPPFYRWDEYQWTNGMEPTRVSHGRDSLTEYTQPICLVHNARGWGYEALFDPFRQRLGVQVYGRGSPDGLIQHREVKVRLTNTLAMVHLKSSDAPGYALYEALASGCPVVCTRRLIWRNRMHDLLVPGETCLVFDRETHDGLTTEDVVNCTVEVEGHLRALRDPTHNRRIGDAGRQRLKELMWCADRAADVESLRDFWRRNFPCG